MPARLPRCSQNKRLAIPDRMNREVFFSRDLFAFFQELKAHNDRAWFNANKTRYDEVVREPLGRFITAAAPRLRTIASSFVADPKPNGKSIMRIYRDLRFSKDRTPYRTHAALHFFHSGCREGAQAPAFYLHLEPGNCLAGSGLWHPDSRTLKKVRDAIAIDGTAWRSVIRSGVGIEGGKLQKPPRGYDPRHPFSQDLRRTEFLSSVRFTESQVCSLGFLDDCLDAYRRMKPLMRFLTESVGLRW